MFALMIFVCLLPFLWGQGLSHLILSLSLVSAVSFNVPIEHRLIIDRPNKKIELHRYLVTKLLSVKVFDLHTLGNANVEQHTERLGFYRVVLSFSTGFRLPITADFYAHPNGDCEQLVAEKILDYAFAEDDDLDIFDSIKKADLRSKSN